ncbi:ral guanine nucleotide dissociation stimulator-like [Molossus nigricans]
MSLCCFPTLRGSGPKKARSERRSGCCALWRKRRRQRLSPSATRHPQRSKEDVVEELADGFTYATHGYKGRERQAGFNVQCRAESSHEDVVEELVHGPHYTICRVRVQVHQDNTTGQSLSESSDEDVVQVLVGGFSSSTSLDQGKGHHATDTSQCQTERAAALTLRLREAPRMRALQEGTLDKVAACMGPAFPGGNICRITTSIPIHPAFSRARQFLDRLFTRSGPPTIRSDAITVFSTSGGTPPYSDQGDTPQDQVRKAIASTAGTWPDQVQGFGQAFRFPWFQLKQASVQVHFPASHHVGHAHLVWIDLELPEPTAVMPEDPPPELQSPPEPQEGPAQRRAPGPARRPGLAWRGLAHSST